MFIVNRIYISKNFVQSTTMKKILEIKNIYFLYSKINFLKSLYFCRIGDI